MLAVGMAHANFAWAWPEEGRAAIAPRLAVIGVGARQQFHVIMLPRRLEPAWPAAQVKWSVNGEPGGNATVGSIDENGLYRAPEKVPGEIHIRAEVPGALNRFVFATLRPAGRPPSYRSTKQWDREEIEKAGLTDPRRIAIDSKAQFLVAGMIRATVLRFSRQGKYQGTFGRGPDGEPLPHEGMCVVAVDSSGRVLAADRKTGPPRVEVFDPNGDWLFGFAPKGAYPWMVAEPSGFAFHPDGRIFLADMDAMRVAVFDRRGKLLGLLREHAPKGNRFNAPAAVAVDAAGDLFVASLYGPCEKIRADTGERLLAFAYPDPPAGPMFIDDVCVDRWGSVFLAVRCGADPVESGPEHGGQAAVLKFTNSGEFLARITLSATAPKRAAVVVDAQDRVYVAFSAADGAGVEEFVPE